MIRPFGAKFSVKNTNSVVGAVSNAFLWGCVSLCCILGGCEDATSTYRAGERLYKANCANCHMDTGAGLGALIPPLANADYLTQHRDALPCVLRHGLADSIVVNGRAYAEKMPGVPRLSEVDITNILNYINHSWGNQNPPYRLDEVRELLQHCQ